MSVQPTGTTIELLGRASAEQWLLTQPGQHAECLSLRTGRITAQYKHVDGEWHRHLPVNGLKRVEPT